MKRLGFNSEREMNLQLAIANAELCPTHNFAGKEIQCWFTGTQQFSTRRLPFQVTPRLGCAACLLYAGATVEVNKPESPTGLDFHAFLCEHYPHTVIRSKSKGKHKPGRSKDSEKRNGRE